MAALYERIDNPHAVDDLLVLQIFGEHNAAARLLGHLQYQRIPIRKAVKAVQINGRENVADGGLGNVKLGEYLDSLFG
jgi:hypothetical protein